LTAARVAASFISQEMFGGKMLKTRGCLVWMGAACLTALWTAPPVRAQSLGELAEREKARRARSAQESKSAGRVVSDEDLAKRRRPGTTDAEGTGSDGQEGASAAASGETAATPSSEEPTGTQAYWRDRLETARKAIEEAQQRATELEGAARASRGAPTATRYEDAAAEAAEKQAARQAFEDAKREVEAAQRAYNELEDEARRAGGL
jgi:hypothetical protein